MNRVKFTKERYMFKVRDRVHGSIIDLNVILLYDDISSSHK